MNLPVFTKDMDPQNLDQLMDQARKASDLLKALSHEVRLVILCLLSEGEKSVSELEETLTMPQAAVSQQLARLRLEGLVRARRDGRMIYYSLVDDQVSSIIATLYELFCKDVRAADR
ncbi:transcriptional regulator [Roseibium aquae]|uniref:Transcriptional regulator n=1 Tax=Roseibium aquae TaxID=1323746 RepID=A0A916TLZ6_9HYPH|nr:metalloregulator ArsR/SmtB family transcription factor [Roseibium aquae]GGB56788.1 transcriptional regulator [Roseibium aquae]